MERRTTRTAIAGLLTTSLCGLALTGSPQATADERKPLVLSPIGGGYESASLRGFAMEVAAQATGRTVDVLVVPSSYGDAPEDRATNLRQAGARATQIDTECDAAVAASPLAGRFPGGCKATLLTLLNRADAMNPASSAAYDSAETDGSYVLGGDQVLAMKVLANSPAEAAMERAHRRGVVFGGTSAGNAVESRSMGAGYAPSGYPQNAMERGQALVFWGDDVAGDERGLSFGSQRMILDQHFYQRGRFGRLLAYTSQSVERYGGAGKVGVGVDLATGLAITDDRTLARPYGASSSAVVDHTTAGRPTWVGPKQTLTVRGLRTHLLAPGTGVTYDAVSRTPSVNGTPSRVKTPRSLPRMWSPHPVVLGGGQNDTASSLPLQSFVSSLRGRGPVVVVAAGYADAASGRAAAARYGAALTAAGWKGSVKTAVHGTDQVTARTVANASGVLLVGGDQSLMQPAVRDPRLRLATLVAALKGPVMTDGAMTAAMGTTYLANPDPKLFDEKASVDQFRTAYPVVQRGLGLVPGYRLEPELTEGYRWGRLYTGAHGSPRTIGAGISERTALRVSHRGAQVVGERSVVTADGRQARWLPGSNGALGALDVFVSTFGPTSRVR